jgi:cytochrome c peroxidase
VKAQHVLLSIAAAMVAATLGVDAPGAEDASVILSPQALAEITQVETEIDRIEAQTIERLAVPPDNQVQQVELLGKLMLYDKQLSVNRNEACAFCHMPETGYRSGVRLNAPPAPIRSVRGLAIAKPQSHAYAARPFCTTIAGSDPAATLDMRAPAAETAIRPPSKPRDLDQSVKWACRISPVRSIAASRRPYRALFGVWGRRPCDRMARRRGAGVCPTGPPPAGDVPVISRRSIAAWPARRSISGNRRRRGPAQVTAFSSKSSVLAGKAKFTAQEQTGAICSAARRNATPVTATAGRARPAVHRLHRQQHQTRQSAPSLLLENRPDALGYVANPAGASFVDGGVGNFLTQGHLLSQPSAVDQRWLELAPGTQARFQVPTLRNVDKRPDPGFVKAYGHNGYFTSLKAIVHFYNTRDVLPRCQPHDANEGTACWPAPESTDNMNTSRVGRLGLSDAEEDTIVSFMQTLTDGFMPINQQ